MFSIEKIRAISSPKIIVLGNHKGIIQSILDFDYLSGKQKPSVVMVVGGSSSTVKYFWGKNSVRINAVPNVDALYGKSLTADYFISTDSGRRVMGNTSKLIDFVDGLVAGVIFAESVPERHAISLRKLSTKHNIAVLGPSSVGLLLPGILKLGAIGGTQPSQQEMSKTFLSGSLAVISTSGGMTNEIISYAARFGKQLSFAAAVGGERYPILKPVDLVRAALEDKQTDSIAFFGELGGQDEYEIADLVRSNKAAKKMTLLAYIAGVSAEMFDSPPQFGHAKALAGSSSEAASEKIKYMNDAGFQAFDTFKKFEDAIRTLPTAINATEGAAAPLATSSNLHDRKEALFTSSVSKDSGGDVSILGHKLVEYIESKSLSEIALSMFLGHEPRSRELIDFFDLSVRLLVDHGPQVSGAVNTMITARAGKDLPSALASGILTIGPRFGGAINGAALEWVRAVEEKVLVGDFVEKFSSEKKYIPGIGHKKYRIDNPDPRVKILIEKFSDSLGVASRFALSVEEITSSKKSQLILNVDGTIAALMIDILHDKEGYDYPAIKSLIETEFFNALFVYARSTGFIAHYLDQKRLGDDLFRLPDDQIDFED